MSFFTRASLTPHECSDTTSVAFETSMAFPSAIAKKKGIYLVYYE